MLEVSPESELRQIWEEETRTLLMNAHRYAVEMWESIRNDTTAPFARMSYSELVQAYLLASQAISPRSPLVMRA